MIQNDTELVDAVVNAGNLLQEIQDFCGRKQIDEAKVRFPRGFIRTAVEHRNTLPNIKDNTLSQNITYALMTLDALEWLVNRTDIAMIALEMIIKQGITIIGSICETLTIRPGERGLGRNNGYKSRTNHLVELNVIDKGLKDDLDWIWDSRNRVHLIDLKTSEFDAYKREDYNRAAKSLECLCSRLKKKFG